MTDLLLPMLLSAEFTFDPTGTLLLLGTTAIAVVYLLIKKKREEAAEEAASVPAPAVPEQTPQPAAAPAPAVEPATPAKAAEPPVLSAAADEVALCGVEEADAAMIIAILCDEIGGDPAALRFRSIRRVDA